MNRRSSPSALASRDVASAHRVYRKRKLCRIARRELAVLRTFTHRIADETITTGDATKLQWRERRCGSYPKDNSSRRDAQLACGDFSGG
ncbi:hypothetical protein [Bradyrhizobium sp. RD5-C2]|uniref:hypothetical protein n=1 Tax=Bradyrhizobium sp. RD5-C2 TaxID=244562 RepID=UPI001CC4E299|nr:hypothetical protein [Bradyrhizobium sp. RD5-C2]